MQDTNQLCNRLIHEFAENYMGKLFYFCLRKTGDPNEAEDLTQDIALNVLTALEKGSVPEFFSAWVWQIARNRYSVWADEKHKRHALVTGSDASDYEIEDDSPGVLDEMIHAEQIALLRRELAFIKSIYRNVVVSYYLDGKSIRDIAASMSLSVSAVEQRLFRARKILKEGMDMAREFGRRSYDPESIGFCTSGSQPGGHPWSAIQRKIPINILCEANNNPSTVQELSVALGIALPYMEEEIELLEDAELLKKTDNGKYLTGFFISPVECQNESNGICCEFAEENYDAIWQLAGKVLKKAQEFGISTDAYTEEDAQMFFAFMIEQKLVNDLLPENIFTKFTRRDGGNWGIIGLEDGASSRLSTVLFNNEGSMKNEALKWEGFQEESSVDKTFSVRRYKSDAPDCDLLGFFAKLACEDGINKNAVGEWENVDESIEEGFLTVSDGGLLKVNAILIENEKNKELLVYIRSTADYCRLLEKMKQTVDRMKTVIEKYSNPYLEEDFDYYVAMSLMTRGFLAPLWANNGLYKGNSAQFCALYY